MVLTYINPKQRIFECYVASWTVARDLGQFHVNMGSSCVLFSLMKFCTRYFFLYQNNPEKLDPSRDKMDPDLGIVMGGYTLLEIFT